MRVESRDSIARSDDDAHASLDLIDTVGVPDADLARRLVRLLNLPAVIERRLADEQATRSAPDRLSA